MCSLSLSLPPAAATVIGVSSQPNFSRTQPDNNNHHNGAATNSRVRKQSFFAVHHTRRKRKRSEATNNNNNNNTTPHFLPEHFLNKKLSQDCCP
jgi:hypothetical protein